MIYSKAVIYKLYCKNITVLEFYIGSAKNKIKREQKHKNAWNNENGDEYDKKAYKFIRENGGMDNWIFEVIEEYPCDNKIELVIRERYHYDLLNPELNMIRPYISEEERKEGCRNYSEKRYKDNREEKLKRNAKHYKDNRKEIRKQQNQKFTCDCGKEYTQSNRLRHCDSKRHKEFLAKKT
jgi:hypothetical protein